MLSKVSILAITLLVAIPTIGIAAPQPAELDDIPDKVESPVTILDTDWRERAQALPTSSGKPLPVSMHVLSRKKADRKIDLHLGTAFKGSKPPGTRLFRKVASGDIIPLAGELYAIGVGSNSITFDLVTNKVAPELRPASTTFTLLGHPAQLFQNAETLEWGSLEVQQTTNSDAPRAKVEIQSPGVTKSGPRPAPEIVEVCAGEILKSAFDQYRVKRIIPPQEVQGLGLGRGRRLVGWIEVEREPVTGK